MFFFYEAFSMLLHSLSKAQAMCGVGLGTRKDICRYLLNTVFEFQETGHLILG